MNVYIYASNIWCEECGKAIHERIMSKMAFNSDDFPKGPYPDGGGESDSPQHCAAGPDCLNAIEFDDGVKIGAWLENKLTEKGIKYVNNAITKGSEISEMWADYYRDYCNINKEGKNEETTTKENTRPLDSQ